MDTSRISAGIHDGPEHNTLQSEAGYIDASGQADFPHPALGQNFTPSPTARRAQAPHLPG
jgi:hypothetical protein